MTMALCHYSCSYHLKENERYYSDSVDRVPDQLQQKERATDLLDAFFLSSGIYSFCGILFLGMMRGQWTHNSFLTVGPFEEGPLQENCNFFYFTLL